MAWKKVHVRTIPNSDTPFEFMSDEVINYIKDQNLYKDE